ncbi:MAG: helix-turn-helix transcriptional regulator [Chromatiaceae bacterium]
MSERTDTDWYHALAHDPDYLAEDAKIGFAVSVERRMRQLGMSKADLARQMATSQAYITKILRGDSNLTIHSMVALARAVDSTLYLHLAPRAAHVRWFEVINGALPPLDTPARDASLWARHATKEPHGPIPIAA